MSLLAMQRDFRSWLQHESADAAERFGRDAMPGLLVYQNNYRSQLMDCLAGAFEQVRAWIGDEAFFAAAAEHIDRVPPSAWTLDAYPAGFPETLAERFGDSPEVAELGWLEFALAEAFVGPDCEAMSPATLQDVDWDVAVLQISPNSFMRSLTTNAPAIWSALSTGEEPPAAVVLPARAVVLVWRADFTSCFRTLEEDEATVLGGASVGIGFRSMCGDLVASLGEERGVARAGELLGRWLRDGLVVGVKSRTPE